MPPVSGTSASGLHFQVFLVEGLVRWNRDRAAAATTQAGAPSSSSLPLMTAVDRLHRRVYGTEAFNLPALTIPVSCVAGVTADVITCRNFVPVTIGTLM